MSIESEDDLKKRIAETKKNYEITAEGILSLDPELFIEEISSEKDLARLDNMKRSLEWVMNQYVPKKDKKSKEHRRKIGLYLSPLRLRINSIKPQEIPITDQRFLTNLKRNTN